MATQKKAWSDLSTRQKRAIYVGGAAELVLTGVALSDLVRRPKEQVRGTKAMWVLSFAVQPFGPLAYLLVGRR